MSDKLLEAINLEPDPEIVGIMMDSLCQVTPVPFPYPHSAACSIGCHRHLIFSLSMSIHNAHFHLQCIELLGANCFTAEQYTKLVELLKDAMEMTFSRASERLKKREDEDYDEQVEEEIEEEVRRAGGGFGGDGSVCTLSLSLFLSLSLSLSLSHPSLPYCTA